MPAVSPPVLAASEQTLMMRPQRARLHRPAAPRATSRTRRRGSRAITRRHSRVGGLGLVVGRMPALFTRMSTAPARFSIAGAPSAHGGGSLMSHGPNGRAAVVRRAAAPARSCRLRVHVDQRAPRAVLAAAHCHRRPVPIVPAAPVTSAILSLQGPDPSHASSALFRPNSPRARKVTTAMNSRYIDMQRPLGGVGAGEPDDQAHHEPGDHRAPEAADAAQHDDEERRHHRVDAHVRADAPDRRHDDARDRRERGAEREHPQAQPREVEAERAHHLAVVRAGLDDRAVLRLLDEEPQRHDQRAPRSRRRRSGTCE